MFESVDDVQQQLERAGLHLRQEHRDGRVPGRASSRSRSSSRGPAGVGKTELAKVVAEATGRELIRLQCYEGLDEAKALYEWEYAKQLLYTQILKDKISEVMAGAKTLREAVERVGARGQRLLLRALHRAAAAPARDHRRTSRRCC